MMDPNDLQWLMSVPLSCLPEAAKMELRSLDNPLATYIPFYRLAERLGYQSPQIKIIETTGRNNWRLQHSPLLELLHDYEGRRGTIGRVQEILQEMNHTALEIIPRYFLRIRRNYVEQNSRTRMNSEEVPYNDRLPYNESGRQNTEATYCGCPECQGTLSGSQPQRSQPHTSNYPSYPSLQQPPPQNPGMQPQVLYIDNTTMQTQSIDSPQPQSRVPQRQNCTMSTQQESSFSIPLDNNGTNIYQAEPWSCDHGERPFDHTISGQTSEATVLQSRFSECNNTVQRENESYQMSDSEQERSACTCDDCRVKSDPDQTRRLYTADQKQSCQQHNTNTISLSQRPTPLGSADILDSGLTNQSNWRYKTNNSDSDETEMKTVHGVNNNQVRNGNGATGVSERPRFNSEQTQGPLCSNSNPRHRLFSMPDTCNTCKSFSKSKDFNMTTRPKRVGESNVQVNRGVSLTESVRGEIADKSENTGSDRHSWPEDRREEIQGLSNKKSYSASAMQETFEQQIRRNKNKSRRGESIRTISSLNERSSSRSVNSTTSERSTSRTTSENDLGISDNNNVARGEGNSSGLNIHQTESNSLNAGSSIGTEPIPSGSSHTTCVVPRARRRSPPINVFVTYSWNPMTDREDFLDHVAELCKTLIANDINVKMDSDPETYRQLMQNSLDFIDQRVREADYVIVCISPTYYADVQPPDDNQPAPQISQLNARYIYDKLRAEYHGNLCRNYRMIPVMFTCTGVTVAHVPDCMRSTLNFSYPADESKIIDLILQLCNS